jgi:hypothetical protein
LAAFVKSTREQHAFAQEIETTTAIHLAFDQFQPVDVAFNRTGAPVNREAGVHRLPIAVKIPTEAAEFRRSGGLDVANPLFELGSTSLANKDHESLCQYPACGQLAAPPAQVGKQKPFGIFQFAPASQ